MQAYKTQARLFKILVHPTRLAILDVLRDGEQCVCHLEAVLGLRQAHISQHLMVLRDIGVVSDRRDGWNIFYRVSKPEIYSLLDAMSLYAGQPNDAQARRAQIQAKKAACPCPKCNPTSRPINCEPTNAASSAAEPNK